MEVQADAHLHARSLTPEAERKPMKAGLYHVRHTIARRDGSSVRARLQLYRTHAYILATHNTTRLYDRVYCTLLLHTVHSYRGVRTQGCACNVAVRLLVPW